MNKEMNMHAPTLKLFTEVFSSYLRANLWHCSIVRTHTKITTGLFVPLLRRIAWLVKYYDPCLNSAWLHSLEYKPYSSPSCFSCIYTEIPNQFVFLVSMQ